MNRNWTWLLLAASLSGCMGTEPDKPKPVLEALSAKGSEFGNTLITGPRKQLDFVLRNSDAGFTSVETLKDIVISVSGTSVTMSETCPSSLEEGESCLISVYFQPTAAGTMAGTLSVASNAEQGTIVVGLSGTGVTTLSPQQGVLVLTGDTSTTFTASVGNTASRTYTVRNVGNATDTLAITGPGSSDTDWSFTNNCAATLAADATCTLTLNFTPSDSGTSVPAAIEITDDYNRDYGKLVIRPVGIGN